MTTRLNVQLIAIISLLLCIPHMSIFASEEKKEDKAVTISYNSLLSAVTEFRGGKPVIRAKRLSIGEDLGKQFAVTAKAQGKSVECPLIWQDVAFFLDGYGNRGDSLAIFGYRGCPFAVEGELEVVKTIEMREETKIEIDQVTDNIFWISSESARPLASTGDSLAEGYEMIVNVIWVFKNKGGIIHDDIT